MDNKNTIQIKVENEEESFTEYTISSYVNCKEEDISDEPGGGPQTNDDSQKNKNDADDSQINAAFRDTKLNCHNKRAILKHFFDNGWTAKSYRDLCKKFPPKKLDEYGKTITKAIEEAQQFVYQECESLCFGNISDWLEVFKTMDVPDNSYYEPAIVINAIVNNEKHPDPEEIGGVDLKQIYSFLCNGLMGLPQMQMDPISARFLANEFETLINEANSDVADTQTLLMKQKLESSLVKRKRQVPPSLDPLWLTEGTIVHNDILNDKNGFTIVHQDIIVADSDGAALAQRRCISNEDNEDTTMGYSDVLNPKTESNQ